MANRPVFVPKLDGRVYVQTEDVSFTWHAGLAVSQKQKSIAALHEAAFKQFGLSPVLEVSSKSTEKLGIELSAFNLDIYHPAVKQHVSVECAFQAAKVYQNGGPYLDLLEGTSLNAKRDSRLRTSGPLIAFQFDGKEWPIEPQTAFYDWLYIQALRHNPDLSVETSKYQAFTDIEFNPQRSINCQAYSVALYIALAKREILEHAISSPQDFLKCISSVAVSNAHKNTLQQGSLF